MKKMKKNTTTNNITPSLRIIEENVISIKVMLNEYISQIKHVRETINSLVKTLDLIDKRLEKLEKQYQTILIRVENKKKRRFLWLR